MKTFSSLCQVFGESLGIILFLFFCFSFNFSFAQTVLLNDTLYGHYFDQNEEAYIGGWIGFEENNEVAVVSDIQGQYALPLLNRTGLIRFTYDGIHEQLKIPTKDAYKLDVVAVSKGTKRIKLNKRAWKKQLFNASLNSELVYAEAYIAVRQEGQKSAWKKYKRQMKRRSHFVLKGQLLNRYHQALPNVLIEIEGSKTRQYTNAAGRFTFLIPKKYFGVAIYHPEALTNDEDLYLKKVSAVYLKR